MDGKTYCIVHSRKIDELETKIIKLRKDGWVCQGGIHVFQHSDGIEREFYQAMIKE